MKTSQTTSKTLAILREVYSQSSLPTVTHDIVKTACDLTGSVHGSFVRVCWKQRRLFIESTIGPDWTDELKNVNVPLGLGITGTTATTGETYVCNDTDRDPNYIQFFPYIRSELSVPVKVNGEVWGIINLDGTEPGEYPPEVVVEVCLFAELIAAAIEYRIKIDRERELYNRLTQAEKLSASGQLLAGIAHEINNPLAAILGTSSLMVSELTNPEHIEAAKLIEKQARRAGDLISHLLSFSRKSKEDDRKEEDLLAVVRESIDFVRPQLRLKKAALEFNLAVDSGLRANMNRVQIQQMLINLITNAQHAVEEKGEKGRISVNIETDGTNAFLSVQDNGTGMSLETRKNLFQAFYTTKKNGLGTGLGLSICREIAIRHQGSLKCTSIEEMGSRFQFQIPLSESVPVAKPGEVADFPAEEKQERRPSRQTESQALIRILIVDDEPAIRWMLEKLFRSISDKIFAVGSAEEALEIASEQPLDFVVSDVHLPGINGVEFFNRMKVLRGAEVPHFVLITGDITCPRLQLLAKGEEVNVLAKPFSPQLLLNSVSECWESGNALKLAA